MTEYDYWKIFPRMPRKVTIGDITVRDGFQHLEKFVSTRAKIFYAEEMIFAGCRNIEVTNPEHRKHAEGQGQFQKTIAPVRPLELFKEPPHNSATGI